jgi:DNA primase
MSQSKYVDFRFVKREVTMVQVLERYGLMTRMYRNGDSITGACPIHEGKNETAFRVSISKNCWNCFSHCQGSNVLDFVAKKEKVSLLKAANLLIEWFNLRIEAPENGHSQTIRQQPVPPVHEKSQFKPKESMPADEQTSGENKPLEFVLKNLPAPERRSIGGVSIVCGRA